MVEVFAYNPAAVIGLSVYALCCLWLVFYGAFEGHGG